MSAEHKDMLLAEARLSSPPSEQFLRHYHVPSLAREKRQLQNYMAVDLAHTVMLVDHVIARLDIVDFADGFTAFKFGKPRAMARAVENLRIG